MAKRNRLPPWHELTRLANGRELLLRPIHPLDAEPLRAGFTLLALVAGSGSALFFFARKPA